MAGVYVVVGAGIAEIADIAFLPLGLPEWTVTLVIVLLLLGFPIALILGWAYDMTPHGVVRASDRPPDPTRSSDSDPGAAIQTPVEPEGASPTTIQAAGGLQASTGPEKTDPGWAVVQGHLSKLLDADATERQEYLADLTREDPTSAAEVASLLEAHESAGPLDDMLEWLHAAAGKMEFEPGMQVAQYQLGKRLGGGGMGVVYQAIDQRLNRSVALKFLSPGIASNQAAKERFLVEARAAAGLDDVNICTILEIGETPTGQLFLAMPFYEGETLQSRIERGPLPAQDALDLARQIARGLASAHRSGIVHRDIKPANVIVTSDGIAKIVDSESPR